MRLPGRSLSNTKQRKPELKIDLLPLQDWLTRAGIPSERLPALLARLDEHWVQDVPSLLRSLPALEMHLPAAAFQTIQNAATKEQAASQNEEGKEWRSSADTASDVVASIPAGGYASPIKFADGFGVRDIGGSMDSARMHHSSRCASMIAAASPACIAQPDSVRRMPFNSQAVVLQSHYEVRAAKARSFQIEAETYRRQLRARSRRALSPEGLLARVWDEGVLVLPVLFVLLIMPAELAFAQPLVDSAALYDLLWFANRAVEVAFSADIAFRTCVAYREAPEQGGKWVFSRRRIFVNYLRTWLLVDLVAATPLELGLWGVRRLGVFSEIASASASTTHPYAAYEALLRLTRLAKLLRPGHVHTWLSPPAGRDTVATGGSSTRTATATKLRLHASLRATLKLLSYAILLSHWLACVWTYVGMRSATPILTAPLTAFSPPLPPPVLAYPSPPPPPHPPLAPSPPAVPPGGTASGSAATLEAQCWLATHGLIEPATALNHARLRAPGAVYGASWATAVSSLLGVGAGSHAATPAGWAEHYVASAMLLIGAAARLLGLAFACSLMCASQPRNRRHRQTHRELSAFCRDLPLTLTGRLRDFFHHGDSLEAAARHSSVLGKLSSKLRADAAYAMAQTLLRGVDFLQPSRPPGRPLTNTTLPLQPLEAPFLANVVLALQPRLHCPRELLRCEQLTIIERGVCAKRGRIITAGGCVGNDVLLARADLRDLEPAVVITFCQVLTIDRPTLLDLARPYTHAASSLKAAAVRMALRRAFVAEARKRVVGDPMDPGQRPLAPLLGTARMFDDSRSICNGACETNAGGTFGDGVDAPRMAANRTLGSQFAKMCSAVEARLLSKLETHTHGRTATAYLTQALAHPQSSGSNAQAPATIEATGPAPPPDNLAAAWPFTVQASTGRRRRSARSLDGRSLDGSESKGSRRCSHRAPMSSRSARGGHHSFSTAMLLERIERLESMRGDGNGESSAFGTALQKRSTFAFPERRSDGSQSPPLSAERRHAKAVSEARMDPGAEAELVC